MKHTIAVLLLYLLGSFLTVQAITPAGTVITNQLEASYIDPATGIVLTAISNSVSITLRPVAAVLLEQDLQQVVVPGETVFLTHTLSNFGNVPDSFVLTLENRLDDDGDLQALKLHHDRNANGVLDSDEPEIETTHELVSGSSVKLVIKGVVANTATDGSQINIKLSAISQNKVAGTKTVSNMDTLTVSGEGSSQQQIRIRFLTPTRTTLENEGTPDFYNNDDFVDAQQYPIDTQVQGSHYDPVRDGVYVEIHAEDIETVSTGVARKLKPIKLVSLVSVNTGDSLQIAIREVAANSGIYRSIRPIRLSSVDSGAGRNCPSNPDVFQESQPDYSQPETGCVLRSVPNDRLRVTISEASATTVVDTAVVEPLGVVFDSSTGTAIADAEVTFMASDNTPARDPVSGQVIEPQATDTAGQFRFPSLVAGSYYVAVSGLKNKHHFPSLLHPSAFPERSVSDYSYGESSFSGISRSGLFTVSDNKPTLTIDIPVDPVLLHLGQQLALEKQVSSPEAMLGDLLTYTISISNQTGEDIKDANVHDVLPVGFKLVTRSVSLSGELRDDLATVSGRSIDFLVGDIPNESIQELVYVVRVSAEAQQGDAINSAYLTAKTLANESLQSVRTHAKVRIRNRGVLSSEGILFGKVHFDKSCDYVADNAPGSAPENIEGLLPLGGVRLYLDDGRYAVTDGAGDYSFYGMEAALHTIKLDAITLPKKVTLKVVDTQQADDPFSYFIDVSSGGYHRADFVAECLQGESAKAMLATITKSNAALRDTDFLNEAGTHAALTENVDTQLEDATEKLDDTSLIASESETMPVSKKAVKKITYQQGKQGTWLWPKGNISTDGRFMAVIRAGVKKPVLYVNDEAVSIENMGEQLGNKKSRAQLLAWYGVELEEGENHLMIKGLGPRGKMRVLAKQTFIKPSRGAEIKITPLQESLVADGGRSSLPIKISIFDKNGHPAIGDYFLTLLTSEGHWKGKDIQSGTEGHQIKISNGEKIVYLRSSSQTGKVHISVKADTLLGETDISQIAHLRPLLVTGYVNISATSGGRRYGRSKFFLKGKVWSDKHLTLSFDSDKPYEGSNGAYREALDKSYYPIHGDAALRGYEAKSRSKLFAKLEKGKRSILWGDYQTDTLTTPDLARVQRTLNGANINVDTGKTQFQLFAAQEDNTHLTEEFRGNGTASNYRLDKQGLVPNSEVIELIIRDRENTGLVISSETLHRLIDYTLDPVTGYLTFHRVVPSLDNDVNPVYIRVSYDIESDGERYLVSGARVQRSLSDEVTVGGSYTHDAHAETGSDLAGAYLTYKPDTTTEITTSVAQMTHGHNDEKGNAYRLSARHAWSNQATSELIMGRTDKGFTNSNSGIIADRQEIKLTHTQKLNKKSRLKIEGTHSESLSQQQQSQTLGATIQTRAGKWQLEGGMRHIEQQTENTHDKTDTVRAGVKRGITILDHKGRIGLGYEQDIKDSDRNYLTAEAEIAVNKKTSLYSRYETGSDLTGALGLSQEATSDRFILGTKSKVSQQLELYSEYRSRDLTGLRSAETASGLRGAYEVEKGLNLTPSLEVVKITEGETLQDSIAASLAVTDVRDDDHRKTLRIETRQGEDTDFYGIEGSYVSRLDDVWSSLVREELHATTSDTEGDYGSHTFTLGLSQRQKDQGKHNGLYLYQWKEDRGINASSDRSVHVLSTHQHYQATDVLELSARLGGKRQTTHLEGGDYRTNTVLLDGRTRYEINDTVDVFVRGGVLGSDHFNEQQYSAGVGVNVTLKKNLRIGVGYNETGFKDKDLDADKQNEEGFFVNLMIKANESWFEWMQKKEDKE